jgi:hypothetical protein
MDGYTGQYAEKITIDEYNRQKDEYTQKALKELQSQMKEQEYKKRSHKRTNSNDYKKENNKRNLEVDIDDFNQHDTPDELINDSDNDNSNDNCNENDNDNEIAIENKEFYDNKNKEYNQSVNFIIKHSIETMKNDNAKSRGSSASNLVREKRKCDIKHKSPISANENTAGMNDGITSAVLAQHEYDNKIINNLKQTNKSLQNEIEDLDKKMHYMKLDMTNLQVENNDLREAFNIIKNNYEKQSKQLSDIKDSEYSNKIKIILLKIIIIVLILVLIIKMY